MRNFDAVALLLIVMFVLTAGYFEDHGPWCFGNGPRIGVVDDNGMMIVAPPRPPRAPRPPVPPAFPHF